MIKAIIFDFGNVLYDLNFDLFYANFSTLLNRNIERDGFPEKLALTIEKYEKGEINTETFIWNFQHYLNGDADPLAIINAWNSLLDNFPSHRWNFLETLTSNHKLYLLSNINELHLSTAYKHIHKVHGKVDFETKFFDAVFYSHLIHCSKPNVDIYDYVEKGLELRGEEIFFVDDRAENVAAAKKKGWKVVHHDPKLDIADVFSIYFRSMGLG